MSRRTLNILIGIFFLTLFVILVSSQKGVSGVMESLGALISSLVE